MQSARPARRRGDDDELAGRHLRAGPHPPGGVGDPVWARRQVPKLRVGQGPAGDLGRLRQRRFLAGLVVDECEVHGRDLTVAQEGGLGHSRRGTDLGDQVVPDTADVDRKGTRWLGHEIDRTEFQSVERDLGVLGGPAREHHDPRRRLEHEAFEHPQAVENGHLHVECDDVGPQLGGET